MTSATRIALLLLGAAILATGLRVFGGVDLADESFYLSTLYRFCLGERPFIHDTSLVQLNFLPLYPFMKLFLWVNGGATGVVLFTRVIYFIFSCLCAAIVYRAQEDERSVLERAVLASLCVLFFPWNIQNFSYNSTPALCLATGTFLWFFAEQRRHYWVLFAAGFFHALSLMTSQVLIGAFVYFLVAATVAWRGDRRKFLVWYLGGGLLVAALVSPFLVNIAYDGFAFARNVIQTAGIKPNLFLTFIRLITDNQFLLGFSVLSGILFYRFRQRPFWLIPFIAASVTPLVENIWLEDRLASTNILVSSFAMLAPLLACLLRPDAFAARRLFTVGWVTSFFGGVMTAWGSSAWTRSSGVGLFAGLLITLRLTFVVLHQEKTANPRYSRFYNLVGIAVLAVPLIFFIFLRQFHSEVPIRELKVRVTSGPFWGLMTFPERARFMLSLESEIKKIPPTARGILFYQHLPGGYLFDTRTPAPGNLWMSGTSGELKEALARTPGQKAVVRVRTYPGMEWSSLNGPFGTEADLYVQANLTLLSESEWFKIYLSK